MSLALGHMFPPSESSSVFAYYKLENQKEDICTESLFDYLQTSLNKCYIKEGILDALLEGDNLKFGYLKFLNI